MDDNIRSMKIKSFQKLVCIVILVLVALFSTTLYFKENNQFVLITNALPTNICALPNRRYIVNRFFNFICNENPRKTLNLSIESSIHICDQLYPTDQNQSLFSRLLLDFQRFNQHKISYADIQNMSASCPGCHRVQIINNQLYHIPNPSASDYETRSRSIKMLLKLITETFPNIRDMDLFFNVQDITALPGNLNDVLFNVPIFALTRTKKIRQGLRHENILLMPCFTLWSWPEARVGRWTTKLESLLNTSSNIRYEEREGKLFWRGILNNWRRKWFHGLTNKYPQFIDIQQNTWAKIDQNLIALTGSAAYRSLEDHCKYKYLLHIEGGSYSSRMKYLLSCGSTVIYDHGDHWEEYWYHLLEHNKNVIVFEHTGNETAVNETLQDLMKNEGQAKEIAQQGRYLISHYLNPNAVSCYWWKLLVEYGKLIAYQPTLHSKAIPMEDFLLGR